MNNWDTIRRELERQSVPRGEPDAFWANFKARARLTAQEAPVAPAARLPWGILAFTGSLAALLLAAIPFLWAPDSLAGAIQVTALDVQAPCDGALILNLVSENGKNAGAMIWVSGLEEPHDPAP